MKYVFSAQERSDLEAARLLCPTGDNPQNVNSQGNWVPFYTKLSSILSEHIVAGDVTGVELANFKNAKLWLDVAIGANGGTGMHSAFIRTYTNFQGELRIGRPFSAQEMQKASNGVALNLYLDLTGRSEKPGLTPWTVPEIGFIAESDAGSIGRTLFSGVLPSEDDAVQYNSAWSGALGFNLLGGSNPYQSWRLLVDPENQESVQAPAVNTLDDFKNLLYAVAAYQRAYQAGFAESFSDLANFVAASLYAAQTGDWPDDNAGPLAAQVSVAASSGNYLGLVEDIASLTPEVSPVVSKIVAVGPNKFLDMLMGAVQGKNLLGTTTDTNFSDTARLFLGDLTPAQLQAIKADLLPSSAALLKQKALADTDDGVTTRAALAALSLVRVDVSPQVASNFALYKSETGQGDITEDWISDRALLLDAIVARSEKGGSGIAYSQTLPVDRSLEFRWIDAAGAAQVFIAENTARKGGVLTPIPSQLIHFGGSGSDTIVGTNNRLGDHLYGDSGNDTLAGKAGDDWLEGGIGDDVLVGGAGDDTLLGGNGFDTYDVAGDSGQDTIVDSDGQGSIKLADRTLSGAGTLLTSPSAGQPYAMWRDDSDPSQPIIYVLNTATNELRIGGHSSTVVINNFQSGMLGIAAPAVQPPAPPPAPQASFDLGTTAGMSAFMTAGTESSTQNLLVKNAAAQYNAGTSTSPVWRNWGSIRTGSGVDVVEGGAAAPVNGIRISGGDGDDRIYAGIATPLSDAIERGDDDEVASVSTSRMLLDGGAGKDQLVGSDARDVMFGGAGDDTFVGGQGGDIIIADGEAGGMFEARSTNLVAGLIVGDNNVGSGLPAQLRVDHSGVEAGWSGRNSTGAYTASYTGLNYTVNPLWSADFSALGALENYETKSLAPLTTNQAMGNDTVFAGRGDDVVNAGKGDDFVFAGEGNDMVAGYEGEDFIEGDEGDDMLLGDMHVLPPPGQQATEIFAFQGADLIFKKTLDAASHGRDYIDGGDGKDVIFGGGKADELFGGDGNDQIFGDDRGLRGAAAGDDYLDGEAGNDSLLGGAGADQLEGGEGDDFLLGDFLDDDNQGGTGDELNGGAGIDILWGGAGDDTLRGGDGSDALWGDGALAESSLDAFTMDNPAISTAAGRDFLDGGAGDDDLYGNAGDDTLDGGAGEDLLDAGAGDDMLAGGDGDDVLYGGDGDDVLDGGLGADRLEGGAGDDTYVVSLQDGSASPSGRTDTLVDTQGANKLRMNGISSSNMGIADVAGDANSVAVGYGVSQAAGGAATVSNWLIVKDGLRSTGVIGTIELQDQTLDFASYVGQTLQRQVINSATSSGQQLLGGALADQLTSSQQNGIVSAGRGDDSITLGGQHNTVRVNKGDGIDSIAGAGAPSAGGMNVVEFGAGIAATDIHTTVNADGSILLKNTAGDTGVLLQGGGVGRIRFADTGQEVLLADLLPQQPGGGQPTDGDDTIHGTAGSDSLRGGLGNDALFGEGGSDTLTADGGNDHLDGGTGDDTYVITAQAGQVTIVNSPGSWDSGSDTVVLPGTKMGSEWKATRVGANMVLDVRQSGAQSGPRVILKDYFDNSNGMDLAWLSGTIKFEDGSTISQAEMMLSISTGTEGDDVLYGFVDGFSSDNVLDARGGNDEVYGLEGQDTLHGGSGNDLLDGGEQGDVLFGDAGNDTLLGGQGDDTLEGGEGNDTLDGGAGADLLRGGAGDDTYVLGTLDYQPSFGGASDIVVDASGSDVLRLEGVTDFSSVKLMRSGDDGYLLLWGGGSVRLQGGEDALTRISLEVAGQRQALGNFAATLLPDPGDVDEQDPQASAKFIARHEAQARNQIEYAKQAGALEFGFNIAAYNAAYGSPGNSWGEVPPIRTPYPIAPGSNGLTPIETNVSFSDLAHSTFVPNNEENGLLRSDAPVSVDAQLGASANSFVFSSGLVNGGDGDDVLLANMHALNRTSTWSDYLVRPAGGGEYYVSHPSVIEGALTVALTARNKLVMTGEVAASWMNGGEGNDSLIGSEVSDVLHGGSGFNALDGRAGADRYLVVQREAADAGYDYIVEHAVSTPLVNGGLNPYGGLPQEVLPADADIDTVEFGPGIHLEDVRFTVMRPSTDSNYVKPAMGQGWVTNEVDQHGAITNGQIMGTGELDLPYLAVELGGRRLAAIELTKLDLEGANLLASTDYWAGDLTGQGVELGPNSGIEFLEFQDGQKISMADALAIAATQLGQQGVRVAHPLADVQVNEDAPVNVVLPATAFADGQGGTLTYTATLANGDPLPSWLQFGLSAVQGAPTWAFSGTPLNSNVGSLNIKVTASNAAGQSASDELVFTVDNVNDAPVVIAPLADQDAVENAAWSFTVPAGTFGDVDAGDVLTYSATWGDGSPLPAWLSFNAATRTLTGLPSRNTGAVIGPSNPNQGSQNIKVTVTDIAGASVSSMFNLRVAPAGQVFTGTAYNDTLNGTTGADTIYGQAGNDTINAGDGDDTLVGGAGGDSMTGGNGADTFLISGTNEGQDRFEGGAGYDTILGSAGDDIIAFNGSYQGNNTVEKIDGGAGYNEIRAYEYGGTMDFSGTELVNIHKIVGNNSNISDIIIGSAQADTFFGGGGQDGISGGDGDDTFLVIGNELTGDRYRGDAGFDQVLGSAGDDTISVWNFAGLNTVEKVDGGGGYNVFAGDQYDNTLDLTNTQLVNINLIDGKSGNDIITGTPGNDIITGGLGDDQVYGGAGDDIFLVGVSETTAADRYQGDAGFDTLLGGSGDDTIFLHHHTGARTVERIDGGAGTNIIRGTQYFNTFDFSGTELINISLIDTGGDNDTIIGSAGNDVIMGGTGNDSIKGGAGDDVFLVNGTSDDDTVQGDAGFDVLQGGAGDDYFGLDKFQDVQTVEKIDGGGGTNVVGGTQYDNILDFSATQIVNVSKIFGGNGNDTITGTNGNDVIEGGNGYDTLRGGNGDDTFLWNGSPTGYDQVEGGAGYDVILGGAGDDTIRLTSFVGAQTVEKIDGGAGTNNLVSGEWDNTLDLSNTEVVNIDWIIGGDYADLIKGSVAGNKITGGKGNDRLLGGLGNDTYRLARTFGSDTIEENDSTAGNEDMAIFDAGIATDQLWFRQDGNNLEVSIIGTNDKFTIKDWYLGSQYHVEKFKTSDGKVLTDTNVQNLVQAMSSFSPPAAGQTTLPANYASSLDGVITSNWQ